MQRSESPDYESAVQQDEPMRRRSSMPDSVVTKSMHDQSDQDEAVGHLKPIAPENVMSDKVMSWDSEDKLTIGAPKLNQMAEEDYQGA